MSNPSSLLSAPKRTRRRWLLWASASVVLVCVIILAFPRALALFSYSGIRRLFYEDLGFSDSWASFLAVIGAFVYAVVWVPLLGWTLSASVWRFKPSKLALAFVG